MEGIENKSQPSKTFLYNKILFIKKCNILFSFLTTPRTLCKGPIVCLALPVEPKFKYLTFINVMKMSLNKHAEMKLVGQMCAVNSRN